MVISSRMFLDSKSQSDLVVAPSLVNAHVPAVSVKASCEEALAVARTRAKMSSMTFRKVSLEVSAEL
jgi:hypothetical protein